MAPLAVLAAHLALPVHAGAPTEPPAKPAAAADALELVELTAADLTKRKDLLEPAVRLRSIFQIFLDLRTMTKPKGGAQASPSEPHLRAECTASYLGRGRFASAQHCVRGTTWSDVVFRRWRYKAGGGRLTVDGHDDFFVRARPLATVGDLVILSLDESRSARMDENWALSPAAGGEPDLGERLFALGYPNEFSARPFAGIGCRVVKPPKDQFEPGYAAACRITGGMSGGPQIRSGSAVQLGVNSTSHGDTVTQPRLASAVP